MLENSAKIMLNKFLNPSLTRHWKLTQNSEEKNIILYFRGYWVLFGQKKSQLAGLFKVSYILIEAQQVLKFLPSENLSLLIFLNIS